MNDLAKIVTVFKIWGWGRASFILAVVLMVNKVITFDQAITLILVALLLERNHLSKRVS